MTELRVSQRGGAVRVACPVPLPSDRRQSEWEDLATRFLGYVFEARPVCLITDESRASDWPFVEGLPTSSVPADGGRFLLVFTRSGSMDLFQQVVRSSDFGWDAVWFAPVEAADEPHVSRLVGSVRVRGADEAPAVMNGEEIVITFGDGCGFWWLNPDRPAAVIAAKLTELANAVGWSCVAESSERGTPEG